MNELTFDILKIVVSVCAAIITVYAVPYLKTLKEDRRYAQILDMDEEKKPFRCCSKEPFPKQQKTVPHHWLMRYVRRK